MVKDRRRATLVSRLGDGMTLVGRKTTFRSQTGDFRTGQSGEPAHEPLAKLLVRQQLTISAMTELFEQIRVDRLAQKLSRTIGKGE